MDKVVHYLLLLAVNIPMIFVNFRILYYNAYNNYKNDAITVPIAYIIGTLIIYIVWAICGYFMGKKYQKGFVYFVLIYWIFSCTTMILSYKLNSSGNEYVILSMIGGFSFIPLCPMTLLISKFFIVSRIMELTIPITVLIIITLFSYFLGNHYKRSDSSINYSK